MIIFSILTYNNILTINLILVNIFVSVNIFIQIIFINEQNKQAANQKLAACFTSSVENSCDFAICQKLL